MAVSEQRKAEIALAVTRIDMREKGLRLFPNELGRKIGNWASATGISRAELLDAYESEVRRFVDETFAAARK